MARKLTRNYDDASVDMTPMLDIVFIMLIFFIVTAVFLDERGLTFAEAKNNTPPDEHIDTIRIYVDAKDRVSVDRIPVELRAVPLRVERLLANKPNASVLVMAHKDASLDPVVTIKDQMNSAGLQSVVKVSEK